MARGADAVTREALERELAAARAERDEAQARAAALAEVLQAINASPQQPGPVFELIISKAMALCDAAFGALMAYENDQLSLLAHRNGSPALVDYWSTPRFVDPSSTISHALREGKTSQILDLAESENYRKRLPMTVVSVEQGNIRTLVQVPLRGERGPIGLFILYRQEVRPFTDRQITLVEAFAAQAVLAMENARLLTEQREALEQQTATAGILHVISQSPTDIAPVMVAVAKAAVRFCGAEDAHVFLRDGGEMVSSAHEGPLSSHPLGYRDALDASNTARADTILEARVTHLPDTLAPDAEAAYRSIRENSIQHGFRAQLNAPMLKDGRAIGCICLRRRDPGAFTPRQITLLETFAAQAVIAIENVRLFSELREALEQQTATSEILRVISGSPTDVSPVLDAVAKAALRFCGAEDSVVQLREGDQWLIVGHEGPMIAEIGSRQPLDRQTAPGRAMLDCRTAHFPDVSALDPVEYAAAHEFSRRHGFRAALAAPMLREGQAIGAVTLRRSAPGAFTERQIEVLESFAAQAVIALQNTRLFTELKESLEYQTATSDVLSVISRSTSELEPVLRSMLAAATRLCGVHMGGVAVRRGDVLRYVTSTGVSAEFDKWLRETPHPMDRTSIAGRAAIDKRVTYIPNLAADPDYAMPLTTTVGNMQSLLAVPLLREDEVVGVMTLGRSNTEPFTERQIGLVRTFADQAVIAMENTRLLADLRESLDYQTATSEVLEVISRSTSDLAPVLNTMLAAAARLCGVGKGDVSIRRDGQMRYAASIGASPAEDAWLRTRVIAADRSTCAGRAMVTRQVVHVLDQAADAELAVPRQISAHQTVLSVPLLREGEPIGVITVLRDHVEAFTERQIALIKTFADQAVIAIENARLLGELRERQSELRVTFDNMGDAVVMFDAHQRLAAWNRNFQEMLDVSDSFLAQRPMLDDYVRLLIGRAELGEVADIEAEMARFHVRFEQQWSAERTRPNGRILEVRNNPVPGGGAVLIYSDITERKKAEANIRTARDAAEAALLQLKAAQANLVQSEKMASLGQLTAGIAHEIKNPLNFVNNFASLSVDLLDELKEIAGPALETLDENKRADLDETMGLLTGNLGKIAEHGKRADGIVKSMLSHSRGGSGDWQASDINALVEEALNLAYHGARAQDKEFNVTLERDFEEDSKPIELVPQDVMRVFLNLCGNGFYAANKRRLAKEAGYRPTLKISTRDLGDKVEIRVRDNGTGIPAEVRDKLFQPFFTTKPTGEGTGLGLSISYDIVTQQHGGSIEVESEVGGFTEFTVRLPRIPRVASARKA
jgi:GAF domain-containing protein/two-component sensor histidine kinase